MFLLRTETHISLDPHGSGPWVPPSPCPCPVPLEVSSGDMHGALTPVTIVPSPVVPPGGPATLSRNVFLVVAWFVFDHRFACEQTKHMHYGNCRRRLCVLGLVRELVHTCCEKVYTEAYFWAL